MEPPAVLAPVAAPDQSLQLQRPVLRTRSALYCFVSWLMLLAIFGSFGALLFVGDPFTASVVVSVLALSNFVRLPLPVGDPLIATIGSYAVPAAVMSITVGSWFVWSGYGRVASSLYISALLFFYKRLCTRRAVDEVRAQFTTVGISLEAQDDAAQHLERVPPPVAMRMTPLGSCLIRDGCVLPGRVAVQERNFSFGDVNYSVDIWTIIESNTSDRPLFFFIHGGSWKGMRPRCNAATRTLHAIASRGWLVVACSYRKKAWPQQVDDSYDALFWTLQNVPGVSRSSRLVIAGNSAGGHLATLVTLRALEAGIAAAIHLCHSVAGANPC